MASKFCFSLASFFALFVALDLVSAAKAAVPRAAKPTTTIVPVDATFTNDFDCPFPIIEQVAGTYRDTLYFDQDGNLTREFLSPRFQGALTVTWINPFTGISLESHEASTIIVYYNPDGSFQKLTNQGLTFMVTVPGAGQLLLVDVGRIGIQRGQGITFDATLHQELFGHVGAFCKYLSGG
jgi:hypothetical protein